MLERLSEIDWDSFGVPDVPKWIRGLASPDREIRVDSWKRLEDNVVAVGATTHEEFGPPSVMLRNDLPRSIVPFLIELLQAENSHTKVIVCDLIAELACYIYIDGEEPYKTRARQVRDAVLDGLNVYIALLKDADPDVRISATFLLSDLLEHHPIAAPQLLTVVGVETEPKVKAVALWTLHNILTGDSTLDGSLSQEYVSLLERLLTTSEMTYVRVMVAVCLVNMLKSDAPQQPVQVIVEAMVTATENRTYLGWHSDLLEFSRSLSRLGADRAVPALLEVVSRSTERLNLYYAAFALLNMAFRQNSLVLTGISKHGSGASLEITIYVTPRATPLPGPKSLTPLQRQILNALVSNGWIWAVKTNLFELFGLTSSRYWMRSMLERL